MARRTHDPPSVPPAEGNYTHCLEVPAGARLLFINGQIPVRRDGSVPADFEGQCHTVWGQPSGRARQRGHAAGALTVVLAETFAAA